MTLSRGKQACATNPLVRELITAPTPHPQFLSGSQVCGCWQTSPGCAAWSWVRPVEAGSWGSALP